jgi:hypothetical protein
MRIHATLEALTQIDTPGISLFLTNEDGVHVFAVGATEDGGPLSTIDQGERVEFAIECENRFSAGRYYVGCSVVQGSAGLEVVLHHERASDVLSYGKALFGIVSIEHTPTFTRLGPGEPIGLSGEARGESLR